MMVLDRHLQGPSSGFVCSLQVQLTLGLGAQGFQKPGIEELSSNRASYSKSPELRNIR